MTATHPIVERESVFDELHRLLQKAADGEGQLAFVAGEAGAGKSIVVATFTGRVATQALVLTGACDPLSTPRPMGPLLDISRDPESGLQDVIDEREDPYRIYSEFLTRLEHTIRPVVVVIEDVHWADDATLDLLTYLGRRVSQTRSLLIATYRDDEVGPGHPVQAVVGDLVPRKDSVTRIAIEPLSREGIRQLAGEKDVDTDSILRLSGGNAFYVSELLAADDGLPQSVNDAVLARVSKLAPGSRRAVEAVSIAPRSLESRFFEPLIGATESDAWDAAQAGVLVERADGFTFRHELARLAVEQSLSSSSHSRLHRTMIDLLAGEPTRDLSRLAHHASRTGDPDLILEYALPAASEASGRHSKKEAVGFLEAAHPHLASLDLATHLGILNDFFTLLSAVDQHDRAKEISAEMMALGETTPDPFLKAKALEASSRASWLTASAEQSNTEIQQAIELLEPLGDSEELAFALYLGAHAQMLDRHYQPAKEMATRCVEMSLRIESPKTHAIGVLTLGTTEIVVGDIEAGVRLLEQSIELARAASQPRTEMIALGMLGSGGGESKIYERALQWLSRTIELGERMDEDYNTAYARAWTARIKCEQGEWDEAVSLAELVNSSDPRIARISPVTAMGALGRIRVRRGDPGGPEILREAIERGRSGSLQHIWAPLCALAEYHWLRHEDDLAIEVLAEPYARVLTTDTPWGRGEIAYWMWRVGGIDRPPENVAEPYRLHMIGDWKASADRWIEIGAPYEEALALMEGDTDAVRRAIEILDRLGARPLATRARQLLREEGISSIPRGPRHSTIQNPARFTRRQLEVCELMASGLANGEIADRLYISKKTVEHHISAIFAKLGVTTRAEAIVAATSLQLGGGKSQT